MRSSSSRGGDADGHRAVDLGTTERMDRLAAGEARHVRARAQDVRENRQIAQMQVEPRPVQHIAVGGWRDVFEVFGCSPGQR